MEYNSNPETQRDFFACIFNDSNNVVHFNFSSYLLPDVLKSSTVFSLKVKTSDNSKDYDRTILSGSIDTCKVSKGVIGNFIVRLLLDKLAEHSNFRFVCPQSKGYYYVRSMPFDPSYVPGFLTANDVNWKLNAMVKLKTAPKQQFVNSFNLKFYGTIAN